MRLKGTFRAEIRDWEGQIDEELEALNFGLSSPAGQYPICWEGFVGDVELVEDSRSVFTLRMTTLSGEVREETSIEGPRSFSLETSSDGILNHHWKVLSSDEFDDFFLSVGEQLMIRLTKVSHQHESLIFPFSVIADEYLLERMMSHLVDNPSLAETLPVRAEYVWIEVETAPRRWTNLEVCMGAELWLGSRDDALMQGEQANQVLLARWTGARWTQGFGSRWLNSCLEWAVSNPYEIPGLQRRILDGGRVSPFLLLFSKVDDLSARTAAIFSDPPGRMMGLKDFDGQFEKVAREAWGNLQEQDSMKKERQEACKVLEGVFDSGLSARLDQLARAVSTGLYATQAAESSTTEQAWELLEETLRAEISAVREPLVAFHLFIADEEEDENRLESMHLREESGKWFLNVELGWMPRISGEALSSDEWASDMQQSEAFELALAAQVNENLLTELGFDNQGSGHFLLSHRATIGPELLAHLVITVLKKGVVYSDTFDILSDLDIFIDAGADSEQVWGPGGKKKSV